MKTKIEKTIEGYVNAEIMQDEANYFIDLHLGLGESIYPKNSFSIEEAIEDVKKWKIE